MSSQKRAGFTIIELLVVIIVIGILAAISVLGYGAWRKSVMTAQVKSDLNAVASAMESARNFSNGYPLTLPSTVTASDGVSLTMYAGGTTTAYCVDGVAIADATVTYYIDSSTKDKGATAGTCATR